MPHDEPTPPPALPTERDAGFYHVRTGNGWIVAEWLVNQWWLCADPQSERDCNFAEIDERRITRPSPVAAGEASGVADEYRVLAGEIGKTIAPTLADRLDALVARWHEVANQHHNQELNAPSPLLRAGAAGMRSVRDNCANELATILEALRLNAPREGWRQGAEAMRAAVLENIDQRSKWGQIQCGAEMLADDIRTLPLPPPGEPT